MPGDRRFGARRSPQNAEQGPSRGSFFQLLWDILGTSQMTEVWFTRGLSGNVRAKPGSQESSVAFLGNPRALAPLSARKEVCLPEYLRNPNRHRRKCHHCGYRPRAQASKTRGPWEGAGMSPAGWVAPGCFRCVGVAGCP